MDKREVEPLVTDLNQNILGTDVALKEIEDLKLYVANVADARLDGLEAERSLAVKPTSADFVFDGEYF